jgi:hypothetical protein
VGSRGKKVQQLSCQKVRAPDLEHHWESSIATALVAAGPRQAGPKVGDGGAVWRDPTGNALSNQPIQTTKPACHITQNECTILFAIDVLLICTKIKNKNECTIQKEKSKLF